MSLGFDFLLESGQFSPCFYAFAARLDAGGVKFRGWAGARLAWGLPQRPQLSLPSCSAIFGAGSPPSRSQDRILLVSQVGQMGKVVASVTDEGWPGLFWLETQSLPCQL